MGRCPRGAGGFSKDTLGSQNGFYKPRTLRSSAGLRRNLRVPLGLLRKDKIQENPEVPDQN